MRLSAEDHIKVTAAVAAAEARTDGEIVTIVADRSDAYHDVALHWAVLAMLLVPAGLAVAPQSWIEGLSALFLGWNGDPTRAQIMLFLLGASIAAFLLVRLLLAATPLRMALTPGSTKTRRVHRRAVLLFRAACEGRTRGRTGVLLYLSLVEHRAEIVADQAIHSKVQPDIWGEAMDALVAEVKDGRPGEGMAQAVAQIGKVLADILPRSAGDTNEIGDRLIEL